MWKENILVLLLSSLAAAKSMDMCERCLCKNGIVDCSLKKMETHMNETVWDGIIGVENFILDFNGFVHIKPFPVFGTRKLSLRHNFISKIDDSAFRFIQNLTEIDLSFNHLTTHSLVPHVFRGDYSPEKYEPLKDLRVLRLSGNLLHSLKNDVFEHLPNLKYLYLDSNPFKIIDLSTAIAISSVYYLEVLDMSGTLLKDFPANVLHAPKFLKVLNLSSNYFTEIPTSLEETHQLHELIINDNPITKITCFPKLESLRVLRMNWMPFLQKIGNHSLCNLTSLEEFYCCHNRHLTEIDENTFVHFPEGEEETNTWPSLRKLHLRNNHLSYLDVNLLSRWDKLEEVDIQMNPWVCDCANQWMLTSLIPVINSTSPSLLSGIICNEPPELLDISLSKLSLKQEKLRCLDLYGNQPENDGRILVSVFICVLILIPIAMSAIAILTYRLHHKSYHRNFSYKHIINNVQQHSTA